ncbi:conserved hypothetical protein [metagenome]|uniref:Zinc-finger domain-containing protein n=1 Tax=metagenome TaxID=256318 RepID=A0A2P2C2V9_9ZZZZ
MMHLGTRVGALVDGQLGDAEAERAWAHVHTCATCRAAVEREGWIKRQLVGLSLADAGEAPAALKGSLCSPGAFARYPDHSDYVADQARGRRFGGLAAIGAGTVGAAMFGVLAFSAAPAQAPTIDRRVPPASLLSTPAATPTTRPGATEVTNRQVTHLMESVLAPWKLGL